MIGAGKNRRTGVVDLVMLPTLARRAPEGLLDGYGLVVVDECHGLGAPAAYAAISQARAARWIGLSATPYRADNLDGLITFACGPVRHSIEPAPTVPQHLVTHTTAFTTQETGTDGPSIQAIYGELAADPGRNQQIAAHIFDAAKRGRRILVLINRIGHLGALAADLRTECLEPLVLHGRLTQAERRSAREQLAEQVDAPHILLAIDKIASEGLDLPHLDTPVLASPAAFKGRVVQQVGRVPRAHARKTSIEVHDYLDAEVPVLARMHARRRRILTRLGFAPAIPDQLGTNASTGADSGKKALATHRTVSAATAKAPARAPANADSRLIRAWARANGYQVADRGRISVEIRAAFERVCDARLRGETLTEDPAPIEQR